MVSMKRFSTLLLATCFIAGSCLLTSTPAFAQDENAEEGREQYREATELEEITVTARKRVEPLQDVAMSVSAMGAKEIETAFATDVRDLVYISPNTLLDDTHQGPGRHYTQQSQHHAKSHAHLFAQAPIRKHHILLFLKPLAASTSNGRPNPRNHFATFCSLQFDI